MRFVATIVATFAVFAAFVRSCSPPPVQLVSSPSVVCRNSLVAILVCSPFARPPSRRDSVFAATPLLAARSPFVPPQFRFVQFVRSSRPVVPPVALFRRGGCAIASYAPALTGRGCATVYT
jgi:hypothetical protein